MIIVPSHVRAQCVFKGQCNHAPAVAEAIHEFANYPSKYLCEYHRDIVQKYIVNDKRGRKSRVV